MLPSHPNHKRLRDALSCFRHVRIASTFVPPDYTITDDGRDKMIHEVVYHSDLDAQENTILKLVKGVGVPGEGPVACSGSALRSGRQEATSPSPANALPHKGHLTDFDTWVNEDTKQP